jgi:hypothetical protein
MDIGKEIRTITVEPVENPVPEREPVKAPPPREPAKPEKVPA